MENPIYRITVELIDSENGSPIPEDQQVTECDGFIIMANQGVDGRIILHDIGSEDAATMIASDETLSAIAAIGKAKRDLHDARWAIELKDKLEKIRAAFE